MTITIGIRELRQHASKYLRRVRAGETVILTDRGEPFAEIRPTAPQGSILDQMIADGRATAPVGSFTEFLVKYPPLPLPPGTQSPSAILAEDREERL